MANMEAYPVKSPAGKRALPAHRLMLRQNSPVLCCRPSSSPLGPPVELQDSGQRKNSAEILRRTCRFYSLTSAPYG